MTARRPIILGNWKMNLGGADSADPAQQLAEAAHNNNVAADLAVLPPFTSLAVVQRIAAGETTLAYGAQDISTNDSGAFTGEISGSMLAELGCRFVLAGHSERRARHGEGDDTINAKVKAALRHQLVPVLCVGEELAIRRTGRHVEHTLAQVDGALDSISVDDATGIVIAYEPVWAIGTGEVATPADAQEVCGAIRDRLEQIYGSETAAQVRILYGGSVKAASAAAILGQADIDGALVGGASLDPAELSAIWRAAGDTVNVAPPDHP